jgi:hypothetical protein
MQFDFLFLSAMTSPQSPEVIPFAYAFAAAKRMAVSWHIRQ